MHFLTKADDINHWNDLKSMIREVSEAVRTITERIKIRPGIAVILGTGLVSFSDLLIKKQVIPFHDIPHLPKTTVAEHRGEFIFGYLDAYPILVLHGRLHYYEGYTMQQITWPVRIACELGIHTLIVSSACGSLNPDIPEGSLMLVRDHLNLMGTNPLIGPNEPSWGPRFPNLAQPYDSKLIEMAHSLAKEGSLPLYEGVHAAVPGPYFLTLAESKMVRLLGADTIGMSMVPEVIVANHASVRCLGIACVTDAVFPKNAPPGQVSHQQVLANGNQIEPQFQWLVENLIKRMD